MKSDFSEFEGKLDSANRKILAGLTTPFAIQTYLDSLPYVSEELESHPAGSNARQAVSLLGWRHAGCAGIRTDWIKARMIDLIPASGLDDDHVLAIFQVDNKFGAVAKSNFAGLRYREPLYRSLRELAMSYFEQFYNVDGLKTLRGYTRPINLSSYNRYDWQTSQAGSDHVVERLYSLKMIPLLSPEQAERLTPVDPRSYQAGMLGTDPAGLYKLEKR